MVGGTLVDGAEVDVGSVSDEHAMNMVVTSIASDTDNRLIRARLRSSLTIENSPPAALTGSDSVIVRRLFVQRPVLDHTGCETAVIRHASPSELFV